MHKQIGVGIIGAGFMGLVHSRAARAAGGRLVGVTDSVGPLAQALAGDLNFERVFSDSEELIADPQVEVVHVCVPNHAHARLVAEAIKAGKHVVCEKPLATTVAEATQLEHLADSAGVVASVPFVYRYYPIVREIRERVRGSEGGRLSVLHGSYLQDWLAFETDSDWRVDPLWAAPRGPLGTSVCIGSILSSSSQLSASPASVPRCSPSFRSDRRRASRSK